MSDRVEPGPNQGNKVYPTTRAMRYASMVDGWVAPTSEAYAADVDPAISGDTLNAFGETHAADSLTVTIDTGEAFVDGRWIATDTTTDVTLAASTAGQTVYAGWQFGSANTVVVGLDADFSANDGRVPIWDFDTDGSGVTNAENRRMLGPPLDSEDGDLVIEAVLRITETVDLQATIETDRTGFVDAPLKIDDTAAYAYFEGMTTVYNNGGNGWRFRDGSASADVFTVSPGGNAAFPEGHVQLRIENRTSDPSDPDTGRMWYRTDLEE